MKIFLFIISILLIYSCNSNKNLKGKVYELSDGEQKIQLNFLTENICSIEQSYECEKLPDSFRNLISKAKYSRLKHKIKYSKTKSLKLNLLVLENVDNDLKNTSNFTYIPDYENLCLPEVKVNSIEYKVRQKIIPGVILNLIKDSLTIKRDTIIFGYKKIPRKR